MISIFSGWFVSIFESYYGTSSISKTLQKYTMLLNDVIKNNTVFNAARMILIAIGIAIIALYFFNELGEKISVKAYNIEVFFRAFLKMIFVIIIIINLLPMLRYGIYAGSYLMAVASGTESNESSFFSTPYITEEYTKKKEYYDYLIASNGSIGGEVQGSTVVFNNTTEGKKVIYSKDPDGTITVTSIRYESFDDMKNDIGTMDSIEVYSIGTYKARFQEGLQKDNDVSHILYILKAFIPFIITFISDIIIFFICFAWSVEILVRAVFCPVAIADIYAHGRGSYGIKYVRKIFALFIQFTVVVVLNVIASEILKSSVFGGNGSTLTAILTNGNFSLDSCITFINALLHGGGYWARIALNVAKITMIIKSLPLCNEIIGAN